MEFVIDNKTNLLKSIKMDISGTQTKEDVKSNLKMSFDVKYSDYDGSFEIIVPEDVLENAVEIEMESEDVVEF